MLDQSVGERMSTRHDINSLADVKRWRNNDRKFLFATLLRVRASVYLSPGR